MRVREHPLQEVFAIVGIAAGVALLFAVQVASTSITSSVRQLTLGVTGDASLEIAARGSGGIDQRIVAEAENLSSVRDAAPVVVRQIAVSGPKGRSPLTLVGVDGRLEKFGGDLVRNFTAKRPDLESLGLFLTTATARKIGVRTGDTLTVESAAVKRKVVLAGIVGRADAGELVDSPIALAPLDE